MNIYTKILIVTSAYTAAIIAGWLLGLDYAAVSCQQDAEFSSEGIRYVCVPRPITGETL